MRIKTLGTEADGTRAIAIDIDELSFRSLLRCLRGLPGIIVADARSSPMTDEAMATIHYKGVEMRLGTPLSDYVIDCLDDSGAFDELVAYLRDYRVRWWERFV